MTQIDLNSYKENQMRRRINTLITKNKINSYDAYVDLIKKDKEKFEQFVNFLTINVSEFYRNPEQWRHMEDKIIPELIQRFGRNLKVWSAACSTGDEPYSLVMAFSRHLPLNQIKVGRSFQISNEIKSRVEFKEHNLLKDAYPSGCHLIVCRNVLIYFTEEAKEDVYRKFNQALTKDGILFIGSTEQILNYRDLNFDRKNAFFFNKI